jgi:hypothetical protein
VPKKSVIQPFAVKQAAVELCDMSANIKKEYFSFNAPNRL